LTPSEWRTTTTSGHTARMTHRRRCTHHAAPSRICSTPLQRARSQCHQCRLRLRHPGPPMAGARHPHNTPRAPAVHHHIINRAGLMTDGTVTVPRCLCKHDTSHTTYIIPFPLRAQRFVVKSSWSTWSLAATRSRQLGVKNISLVLFYCYCSLLMLSLLF
jgi:hypothetical protein